MNLLNKASHSQFVIRKWSFVNDQSHPKFDVRNEIIYNTEVLKYNLCDYNDAYIFVRSDIFTTAHNNQTPVTLKKCVPFKCITKIDETTIGGAEDLDLVVPMYTLLEYSSNYSDTSGQTKLLENTSK